MATTIWYEWRCLCDTELEPNKVKTVITKSNVAPTVCPTNAAHGIVPGSATIINYISRKGVALDAKDDDGRQVVSIGMFPDWMNPSVIGRSDNLSAGTRCNGQKLQFCHSNGSSEVIIIPVRFVDYIQILGADLHVIGANRDDYISFNIVAPATAVTPVNGTGNANLYPIGPGKNLIVPAAGDGYHNVDLTTPLNVNVAGQQGQPTLITAATPIPAFNENGTKYGFWDWDRITGAITPNVGQCGNANLLDHEMVLLKYASEVCVFAGVGETFKHKFGFVHRGGPLLPHWRCDLITTRASSHAPSDPPVIYNLIMNIARKNTA
jgi:hypothetical protein